MLLRSSVSIHRKRSNLPATPLMTPDELATAWRDSSYVFRSSRVTPEDLAAQIERDEFHLKRKITYSAGHPREPVQLHPVEGMSTGAIIDRVVNEGGIERARILREIANGTAVLGIDRHFVRDALERGSRSNRGATAAAGQTDGGGPREWNRAELTTLVGSYLEKLRFQDLKIGFRPAEHVSDLRDQSFASRSTDQVRVALQFVSAVLAMRSLRWLLAYRPAEQIPEAIATDIGELLTEHGLVAAGPSIEANTGINLHAEASENGDAQGLTNAPPGNPSPASKLSESREFVRDVAVRDWILANANGCCEACGSEAPFRDDVGAPFLEVHHVVPLAEKGPDIVSNTAAVCPNCHRRFHHSADRLEFVAALYDRVKRLDRIA